MLSKSLRGRTAFNKSIVSRCGWYEIIHYAERLIYSGRNKAGDDERLALSPEEASLGKYSVGKRKKTGRAKGCFPSCACLLSFWMIIGPAATRHDTCAWESLSALNFREVSTYEREVDCSSLSSLSLPLVVPWLMERNKSSSLFAKMICDTIHS